MSAMYEKIFVPVDNSEHSLASADLAVKLASEFGAEVVGSHAYAARLHDYRFKQMEFTLPEEYLVEEEMEKQRKVHDSLITMGLELISDSYLVVMGKKARAADVPFKAKMYDGKNYKVISDDINSSDYDLVIMGALGLGAVRDSQIGTVCERVCRRVKTDVLVMKNTAPIDDQLSPTLQALVEDAPGGDGAVDDAEPATEPTEVGHTAGGNIVVAVDGSPEAYAGLKTAIELGKRYGKQVEAIAVYDPYLHYAMFNSLVNVLTEKAAKVFRFEEQEQLHEDVIDTGLAKIYQSHLEVAHRVAADEGVDLKITLLDGKAFEKILEYARREKPWLLVMGRIGVHSDEDMDIGGNTENLLRLAPCNVLLSSRRFSPNVDVKAEESMMWTEPAKEILDKAPDFAKGIARTIVHRWAMERGHSVITTSVMEGALSTILPRSSMIKMGIIAEDLAKQEIEQADVAVHICEECGWVARGFEPTECTVCGASPEQIRQMDREAIEKLGPLEGAIEEQKAFDNKKLKWTRDARELLNTLEDGYQRRRARAQIEKKARVRNLDTITKQMVAPAVGVTLEDTGKLEKQGKMGTRAVDSGTSGAQNVRDGEYSWTPEAVARLERVPEGFMRNATKKRIEKVADARETDLVDLDIVEEGIKEGLKIMEDVIAKQNAKKTAAGGDDNDATGSNSDSGTTDGSE